MAENDKLCGVCFSSMADLAASEMADKINEAEKKIESEDDSAHWSDASGGEDSFREIKHNAISVGSECLDCNSVICH